MPAEWSQSSVLEQERHPYLALLPASLKITASPGRQRGQHTSQSASSSLKLSLLYRFVFLTGRMRRSVHLEWFLFHRHDDSLSLIKVEKPKPFRQAYYLPPPHSSNESVTGNSSGRIISKMSLSGFQSPFIKLRLCILGKTHCCCFFVSLSFLYFPVSAQSEICFPSWFFSGLYLQKTQTD